MKVDLIKEYELWYSYVEIFTFEVTFKNEIGLHEGINMLCLIEFVLMHQSIVGNKLIYMGFDTLICHSCAIQENCLM